MQIESILQQGKGRTKLKFDNGREIVLYLAEFRQLKLSEGDIIDDVLYRHIIYDIVGLRAKKRAMYLLEKMDRTEKQLRDKLEAGDYPAEAVELALDYVKSYHYIDDYRYACTYIRMGQEKKSAQLLKLDLMKKGVARDIISQALEDEFEADELVQIRQWLVKKKYDMDEKDRTKKQKMYQFLMRKGFRSSDILKAMRMSEYD